jgi:hypothetical protein
VTRVHKATHRHFLAELEFFNLCAHRIDRAHNFVAWHQWVVAASPIVFREMQIGMAHAAKSDVYAHIFGADVSALNVMGNQVLV